METQTCVPVDHNSDRTIDGHQFALIQCSVNGKIIVHLKTALSFLLSIFVFHLGGGTAEKEK